LVGAQRTVVHDIPVMVVPQRLWADYQEPAMPDIDVSMYKIIGAHVFVRERAYKVCNMTS